MLRYLRFSQFLLFWGFGTDFPPRSSCIETTEPVRAAIDFSILVIRLAGLMVTVRALFQAAKKRNIKSGIN